jgi:hypothetical protein
MVNKDHTASWSIFVQLNTDSIPVEDHWRWSARENVAGSYPALLQGTSPSEISARLDAEIAVNREIDRRNSLTIYEYTPWER